MERNSAEEILLSPPEDPPFLDVAAEAKLSKRKKQ
jgi:hypothetical protein